MGQRGSDLRRQSEIERGSGVSMGCRLSRHIGVALVVGLIALGCASVRLADPAQDITSKVFVVPPGKALIYVVRDGRFI